MRPLLGIELGPSRCVLVVIGDGAAAPGPLHVIAQHVVKYENPVTLAADLRRLRIAHRLPCCARVVLWPHAGDSGVIPVDAAGGSSGVRLDLWRLRDWKFGPPGRAAALADRYAFAAQIIPHLARAISTARDRYGARVERLVLCGSSSALRTLAAPLTEELDLEVETLDGAGAAGFPVEADPDAAAAVQLGAGAAIAPAEAGIIPGLGQPVPTRARVLAGAAAAAAVILLVLLFWPARPVPSSRTRASGPVKSRRAAQVPNLRSASLWGSIAQENR